VDIKRLSEGCMMQCLKAVLVNAMAVSLLMPATAIAKQAGGTRDLRIVVHPKYPPNIRPGNPPKQRWHGYGFLPGYRQPPDLADWRDRSARYRGRYQPYELRYWSNGQLRYGWGGAGFYHGRWNGGSFGPCWTSTPIGMMWNCGR
jgi:hypothetical protein